MEAVERALYELGITAAGLALLVAGVVVWGRIWDAFDLGDLGDEPADTPGTGGVNRAPLPWDDYPDRERPEEPQEESEP